MNPKDVSWHRRSEKVSLSNHASLGNIEILVTDTDATAEAKICNGLAPNTPTVSIQAHSSRYWSIPACVANATALTDLYLYNMIIVSFASLPSSLSTFTCSNCSFAPSTAATSADGFGEGGSLDWIEIWSVFPSLDTFSISNSLDVRGTLPTMLPYSVGSLTLRGNAGITGTIPSTLFAAYAPLSGYISTSLTVIVDECSLTGNVPPNLLQPLSNKRFNFIHLSVKSNALTGTFPPNLFSSMNATTFTYLFVYFNNNPGLTASLSTFSLPSFTAGGSLTLGLSNISMQGTIPSTLLSNFKDMRRIDLAIANNQITGTLPPQLFNNSWWTTGTAAAVIDFSNNDLSGTIPNNFFTSSLTRNTTFTELSILLGGNQLEGSIPPNLLYIPADVMGVLKRSSTDWSEKTGHQIVQRDESSISATSSSIQATSLITSNVTAKFTLDLSSNHLNGSIPSILLNNVLGPVSTSTNPLTITLNLQNNRFIGVFSEGLVLAIPQNLNYKFVVNVTSNLLSGLPPTSCWRSMPLSYYFANNSLDGIFPSEALKDCPFTVLDVSRNPKLRGTLHPQLFNSSLLSLLAAHTNLTGAVPIFVSSKISKIDLSDTDIDFCKAPWDASRWTAAKSETCLLYDTSACACPTSYTRCSMSCNPVSPAPIAPCANAPKLGPEFVCVNGVWVAPSTNVTVLVLPSSGGTVIVNGNVTSSSIVFTSLGSTLIIGGCPNNLTSIEIVLSPEEIERLSKTKTFQNLLTYSNSTCALNLSDVALSTKTSGSCKSVKADKLVSDDGKTLGAYFVLNSSRCNVWWIVLVSVIAGVVVLGLIVATVVGVVLKNRKSKKQFSRLEQGTSAPVSATG